ncbi:MAG: pyridoxamine 5'-phosphate oxidase family protein [Proteobacteria bacterium]|nr:MAG: pyridoxamine 5'-phosphate oxidase family protein [Pseudomonadota bacterium]
MTLTTAPSPRTRLRRHPERGHYDVDTLAAIIDDAWVCHVSFMLDGTVHAMPTAHWRVGEYLYIHGARASRMLKALTDSDACVTLAQVDGLVLARSAFHHSMNFRSVVAYGRFEVVDDDAHKLDTMKAFIDKVAPGRWASLRPVTDKELNATTVLRLKLSEASAKIRSGGVKDDDADLDWPVWAGVLPLRLQAGTPVTEPDSQVADYPLPG